MTTKSNHAKNGMLARRTAIVWNAAAAVVISSLTVGCGTGASGTDSTRLHGAGSTFAYPLYTKWADAFGKDHSNVEIDYQSIGSGGGIAQVTAGRVEFGATDAPMTDAQMKAFSEERGCEVLHVPTALGADVPAYNLPGAEADLKFTARALAGIFLGTISKWNDPELTSANPGVRLPAADIAVIHRSDGSGTTYVWTDYLSKVSDEWRTKVGRGTSIKWPIGAGASGNQGVTDLIKATPNSIGYVELIYALRGQLPFGHIQNAAGQFIKADLPSVTAAAAASADSMPEDFRVSITNASGSGAYPVSSFTWILVPAKIRHAGQKQALTAFLNWSLVDGQRFTEHLSYAPLPDAVVSKAKRAVTLIQ